MDKCDRLWISVIGSIQLYPDLSSSIQLYPALSSSIQLYSLGPDLIHTYLPLIVKVSTAFSTGLDRFLHDPDRFLHDPDRFL